MTKKDLIRRIAARTGHSQTTVQAIIDSFTESTGEALSQGQPVSLPGFGTFGLSYRKARTARNPSTGEQMSIQAKISPKFTPGKRLKDAALAVPTA
ncbi:HU family DNA-binding protein [Pseudomonas neustonica]|uniref:HU family DNA-binding protein n=1 Tax=Pseudomonas neustonica TaxID=2487346 RepID=UPI003F457CF9